MQRGISFEDVLDKIEVKDIIGRKIHPNSDKYPNQQIFIIEIKQMGIGYQNLIQTLVHNYAIGKVKLEI